MNYEIKELGLGGVLDYTFRLFKDNFAFVAAVVGILVIPPSIIFGLLMLIFTESIEAANNTALPLAQMPSVGLIVLIGLSFIVLGLSGVLAQGVISYGIAHRYLGNPLSFREAMGHAFRRFGRLIWVSILVVLGVGTGMLFFVIPGIYLIFAWYIAIPALMFEDCSAPASLGRSRTLMVGQKGKLFVLGFLLGIIQLAAAGVIALVPEPYTEVILSHTVLGLLGGFNGVALTVFYFSARCAVENFDLELLTQMLEPVEQDTQSAL